jgi:hypothetical protein
MDPKAPSAWVPYVHVDDADATAEKARALGAAICVPPTDIPNVGRLSLLADPQGRCWASSRSCRALEEGLQAAGLTAQCGDVHAGERASLATNA